MRLREHCLTWNPAVDAILLYCETINIWRKAWGGILKSWWSSWTPRSTAFTFYFYFCLPFWTCLLTTFHIFRMTRKTGSRGTANFVISFDKREASISFTEVKGKVILLSCIFLWPPHSLKLLQVRRQYTADDSGKFVPVVAFECRGAEPSANFFLQHHSIFLKIQKVDC